MIAMTPRRVLLWSIIAVLLLWIVSQKPVGQLTQVAVKRDFIGYWSVTRLFLSGRNPYDPAALSEIYRQYGQSSIRGQVTWAPPWTFLLLCPFAAVDVSLASLLWFLLNIVVVIAFADYMWRSFGGPERCRWRIWLVAILFIPGTLALNLGQTSPILLAGLLGFFSALDRKRYYLAGFSVYLLSVKPHVVLLFLYILLLWIIRYRKYRILLGAVTGVGLACFFSLIRNPHVYEEYLRAISAYHGPMVWETPTLGTLLRLLFKTRSYLLQITPTLLGFALATILWHRWRDRFAWEIYGTDILLISAATSFYAWTFDWVVILPAVLPLLASACRNFRKHWAWAFWCFAVQVTLVIQLVVQAEYVVTAWFPLAVGLLYWLHGSRWRQFAKTDA